MKNYSRLFAVMMVVLFACSRTNPLQGNDGPGDPEIITLQPLRSIDLLPQVPEPSGLAFDAIRHSLYVVSDSQPDLFEIDFTGAVQHKIAAAGADLEGVALSLTGDSLYIVEERNQQVVTLSRAGARLHSLPVRVATLDNNALEGVTVDDHGDLWVINEKNPRLLLHFHGDQELGRQEITRVDDLSDLCFDPADRSLWIVSDESRKVIKLSTTGTLLGEWQLPFSKGEGIAFAGDRMYIVNDQDAHLYIFAKPQ